MATRHSTRSISAAKAADFMRLLSYYLVRNYVEQSSFETLKSAMETGEQEEAATRLWQSNGQLTAAARQRLLAEGEPLAKALDSDMAMLAVELARDHDVERLRELRPQLAVELKRLKLQGVPTGRKAADLECLVTLHQAAAIVQRSKRTLERLIEQGKFPAPRVEGGGGKPHEYAWSEVRPVLTAEYGHELPERFPADRMPS